MSRLAYLFLFFSLCLPHTAALAALIPEAIPYATAVCEEAGFSIEAIQARQEQAGYAPGDRTQWFFASGRSPKAIVLMIHGVGMRASGMNPLLEPIRDDGFDILRATLVGHGGSKSEEGHASRELWLGNVLESYCIARARAEGLRLPLYFVGYSLGALVNLDLMNLGPRQNVEYDRMVLLAPAISLHDHVLSLRYLWPLGYLFMRNHVNLFRSLIESYEVLTAHGFAASNAPTLIFLDPKDELVSAQKLDGLIDRYGLSQWKRVDLSNRGAEQKKAHHYIIFPPALGQVEWNRMVSGAIRFLN